MNIGRLMSFPLGLGRKLFRSDEFRPHMPDIEHHPDLSALFASARIRLSNPPPLAGDEVEGRRAIALMTPAREIILLPCPAPGSVADEQVAPVKEILPSEPPLKVTAIAYTSVEALNRDKNKTKCIPFLGNLVAFGYLGHSVVVFEGHPSAFEDGVRDSDVLIVDSGMKPFLQSGWIGVARRVMRPDAKILIFDRKTLVVTRIVGNSADDQGLPSVSPTREQFYAELLLVVLAVGRRASVLIASGQQVPSLSDFTDNPAYLERAARLMPESLNADGVIDSIINTAKLGPARKGVLKMPMYSEADLRPVGVWTYHLELQRDAEGRRQILIER